jgi:hypothetical protein
MNATRGWALGAAALSFILVTFAVAVGLGVSSTSPTWRDASAALAILSGIYLILQAIVSFGLGGYIAGRAQSALDPDRRGGKPRWLSAGTAMAAPVVRGTRAARRSKCPHCQEKDETRQEFCYQLAFTKQTDHVRFSFDPLSPIPCYGGPLGASRDQVILDRWRPRRKSACQSLSDYSAEAACSAGLPKTLRQPSLRLARCLRMQAVIRCTFGISDAQSRRTSPVQSRR